MRVGGILWGGQPAGLAAPQNPSPFRRFIWYYEGVKSEKVLQVPASHKDEIEVVHAGFLGEEGR